MPQQIKAPLTFEEQMQQNMQQLDAGIQAIQNLKFNPYNIGSSQASPIPGASDIGNINGFTTPVIKNDGTQLEGNGEQGGDNFKQNAKDFLKQNGQNMFNAGLNILGNSFNDVENSKGVDTAIQAMDAIGDKVPVVKILSTAFKGINSLGGKNARTFSVNQDTANAVGSSYGGSMADITNAAQNSGKKYGLFSGKKRRKANAAMNEAERQQDIMTGIADENRDMQAMAGNQFNYTRYQYDMNGGYDMRYMRAAKQGMKITDRIEFFKQERNNIRINLDTREIEWEPIISDNTYWEPVITDYVEEFKEGGSITIEIEEWEPEIEDRTYWEPIITDAIEEFKEGGSIKEELETPEIEETNQKNLIPEGALHKNKHHMEHTEGLTQKGIPVIDNTGEQQAEIELDEIIFTLEVTKKLEELYKDGSDEAAIEAGKLLVKEILFNTDDRTGLIAKCEKGGKINEVE